MAWDIEGTKRKILNAAVARFAELGPDGATVELIAKTAGVNKERVYKYFGDKQSLFRTVLSEELAKVAEAVAVESLSIKDIGEYAGRAYDYHLEHPELIRLLRWEGLVLEGEVPDEEVRHEFYVVKTRAIKEAQDAGVLTRDVDADHLAFLILGLAGWWAALPQVARMFAGKDATDERARRRASVVLAARRLALAP